MPHAGAATFRAANPGDLFHLEALLGHAAISTTRMYLADDEQSEQRDAVDLAFVPGRPAVVGALPPISRV